MILRRSTVPSRPIESGSESYEAMTPSTVNLSRVLTIYAVWSALIGAGFFVGAGTSWVLAALIALLPLANLALVAVRGYEIRSDAIAIGPWFSCQLA
jgi:hypothetical protein